MFTLCCRVLSRVLCLACVCNLLLPGAMLYYCFSAMACGVQNGMITKYSGGEWRRGRQAGCLHDASDDDGGGGGGVVLIVIAFSRCLV